MSSNFRIERAGDDLPGAFHLYEDSVIAWLRKSVGERDRWREHRLVQCVRRVPLAGDLEGGHRRRSRRVHMREDAAVAPNEHRMARHTHVQLEVTYGPARFIIE